MYCTYGKRLRRLFPLSYSNRLSLIQAKSSQGFLNIRRRPTDESRVSQWGVWRVQANQPTTLPAPLLHQLPNRRHLTIHRPGNDCILSNLNSGM